MSDLAATNCGCNEGNNGCCNSIIWLLILSSLCGNGTGLMNGGGCGCGDNSCMWIILLLLFCGNGNDGSFFNNGCGCGC